MDANDNLKHLIELVTEDTRRQASPFVIRRQELTVDFTDRQKQLFDQALIAKFIAVESAERIEEALAFAREATIQISMMEVLADQFAARGPTQTSGFSQRVLCLKCGGHEIVRHGTVMQCHDCGTVQ